MASQVPSRRAFSLIEILITLLITAIIGTGVYQGVMSSSDAGARSKDRAEALRLLQESIETTRIDAVNIPTYFDSMHGDPEWVNVVNEAYPEGFFKSKKEMFESLNSDIQKFSISIKWTDKDGFERVVSQHMTLSRPPLKLFGSIKGRVYEKGNMGISVKGATVTITQGPSYNSKFEAGDDGNFRFAQVLVGDNYKLHAEAKKYLPGDTAVFKVNEGQTTTVDIALEKEPKRIGKIDVKVFDEEHAGALVPGGIHLDLYQDGDRCTKAACQKNASNGRALFEIEFADDDPDVLCYTLTTGYDQSTYPFFYTSSSGAWCGYQQAYYDYRGWSSAVQASPLNPWFGDAGSDVAGGICISPFKTREVSVFLRKAPVKNIDVHVYTEKGDASQASVGLMGSSGRQWASAETDGAGNCRLSFPDFASIRDMDLSGERFFVQADKSYEYKSGCCDQTSWDNVRGFWPESSSVRFQEIPSSCSIQLDLPDNEEVACGGVQATVLDMSNGTSPVSGANVSLTYGACSTDASGVCAISKCAGGSTYRFTKDGTYWYNISASGYYATSSGVYKAPSFTVRINEADKENDFTAMLYPMGYGSVKVRVKGGASCDEDVPAQVYLYPYSGGSQYLGAPGSDPNFVVFNDVPESWPLPSPPAGVANLSRTHTVYAYASGYESKGQYGVTVEKDKETAIDLCLPPEVPPDPPPPPGGL